MGTTQNESLVVVWPFQVSSQIGVLLPLSQSASIPTVKLPIH